MFDQVFDEQQIFKREHILQKRFHCKKLNPIVPVLEDFLIFLTRKSISIIAFVLW